MTQPRATAAYEVPLWRGLAVFRFASLAYAVILVVSNFRTYDHPVAGWIVVAVMVAWSAATVRLYAIRRARRLPAILPDLVITAGCLAASRWVIGPAGLADGLPTLTVTWMVCPTIAVAIAYGSLWAAGAAAGMGAVDLSTRRVVSQSTLTGTVVMILAAFAIGYLARLAADVQDRLRRAAALEAATRERERLARAIHDDVLQVITLVKRRAAELGGEAAELGRLAAGQEVALRALITRSDEEARSDGVADLSAALAGFASPTVALATPAAGVWLPAHTAGEVAAAVGAALDNVRTHASGARAWILVEDEPVTVTVTVRDDGPGIPDGRLESAAAEGRIGVTQSIRGRITDIGGSASITSSPGQGTEVELRVPRASPDGRPPIW